jgi:hypothetical protein
MKEMRSDRKIKTQFDRDNQGKSGDAILTYEYQSREVANSVSFPAANGRRGGDDLAVGVESCARNPAMFRYRQYAAFYGFP